MIVAAGRRSIEKEGRSRVREGRTASREKEYLADHQNRGEEKDKNDPGSEAGRIKSYALWI
jgi:hypothetical protein